MVGLVPYLDMLVVLPVFGSYTNLGISAMFYVEHERFVVEVQTVMFLEGDKIMYTHPGGGGVK